MKTGQRVIWVPSEVEGHERNDEASNEWAAPLGRKMTRVEFERYQLWAGHLQQGTVTKVSDEFITIQLFDGDWPAAVVSECQYPLGIDLGEYWARVQWSPDHVPFDTKHGKAERGVDQ